MKKYNVKINGTDYSVSLITIKDKTVNVTINDIQYEAEVEGIDSNPAHIPTPKIQPQPLRQHDAPIVKKTETTNKSHSVVSPLPGIILELRVKEGDFVKSSQTLLILESMKMENAIESEKEGMVEKINVQPGDTIMQGDLLFTIK